MLGNTLRFNQATFKKTVLKKRETPIENPKLTSAKQFPIENMYSGTLKKTGKLLMGNCPFHQEDTPSFAIYTQTNTWNCFAGCGGGDSLTYYMKLKGVDFTTALEELSR